MRLHTDLITKKDIHAATRNLPGVYATVSQHGSRSKDRAFEVSLEGNGYQKNSGNRDAGEEIGATWDEWGVFLAALYEIDPDAFWGSAKYPVYRDAADFHRKTAWRFEFPEEGLPADTHKRHTWDYAGVRTSQCTRCSAKKRG